MILLIFSSLNIRGYPDVSPNPFRRIPFRRSRFAERTFRRMDVSPKGRFAEWTFRRTDVSPNGRFAERTFHRKDVSPNGRFAENFSAYIMITLTKISFR